MGCRRRFDTLKRVSMAMQSGAVGAFIQVLLPPPLAREGPWLPPPLWCLHAIIHGDAIWCLKGEVAFFTVMLAGDVLLVDCWLNVQCWVELCSGMVLLMG
jgi:hypothetical protein